MMQEPIRVLHVFGRLDAGGAESRTMDIYRKIDRNKVQFDFAIHTDEECVFSQEIRDLGGKIYSFPRFTGKNFFHYKKCWKQFFKNNPGYKIIHGHQTSTAFIYLQVAKKFSIPVRIAHSRNSNKDSTIKKYTSKLSRFPATDLLAVSKVAGASEFGNKALRKHEVKIVPNAIDASKYSFDQDTRIKKRNELGLRDNLVVGHIGRLHPQKNHRFLLQIFKSLLSVNTQAKLILVGEGELQNNIKQQVSDLQLENQVYFLGRRSDVPELLQAFDILLFPSWYEGLPGVVLEAQAAGLPSIISDTITDEVKITDLVDYVSLDRQTDYWAKMTFNKATITNRENTYNKVVEAGYDTVAIGKWYEDFYFNNITQVKIKR